jgi:hypothetical protein
VVDAQERVDELCRDLRYAEKPWDRGEATETSADLGMIPDGPSPIPPAAAEYSLRTPGCRWHQRAPSDPRPRGRVTFPGRARSAASNRAAADLRDARNRARVGDISVFQVLAARRGADHRLPLDRPELCGTEALV